MVGLPKPTKRSPMLGNPFVRASDVLEVCASSPLGKRTFAATYLLLFMASIRYTDAKIVAHFWISNTAVRGVALRLERHSRPVIEWGAPITAIGAPDGRWVDTEP